MPLLGVVLKRFSRAMSVVELVEKEVDQLSGPEAEVLADTLQLAREELETVFNDLAFRRGGRQ